MMRDNHLDSRPDDGWGRQGRWTVAAAGQFVRERIPVPCSVPEAGRLVLELVGSSRDSIAETAGPMTFRIVRRYRPTWATALGFLVAPLFVRRTEACRIAVIEARIGAELLIEGELDAALHEALLQLGRVPEAARVATLGPRPVPQVLASQLTSPARPNQPGPAAPNGLPSYRPESARAAQDLGRPTPGRGLLDAAPAGAAAGRPAAGDSPFAEPGSRDGAGAKEPVPPREDAVPVAGVMQRPSMPFQPLATSSRNGNGSGGLPGSLGGGPVARSGSAKGTFGPGSGSGAGLDLPWERRADLQPGSSSGGPGQGGPGQSAPGRAELDQPAPPPAPPTAAMAALPAPLLQLEVTIDSGERSMVGPLLLIGRAPSRGENESHAKLLTVNDPSLSVSKTHLALGVDPTGLWVVDRNSTNGTWIDDGRGELRPVEAGKRTQVPPGARVLVGERVLSFARLEG
jgi:hypothetical protein